ncbi:MAG: sedoheptulose 7-phosphate cyclase [Propionibacteriales bacterium]|nr:sedoheptulose 7-phosphate cyclase [Propionibacteriales bacterium]
MRSATALTQGLHHHVHRTRGDLPSPSTAVPDPMQTPRFGADASWTVEAVQQVRYHVVRSQGLFDVDNTTLLDGCADAPMAAGERRLVIVDSSVDVLHGDRIRAWFDAHGVGATIVPLRADEEVKQWDSVSTVLDAMNAFGIDRRREPVLAVGGGVLTDVVGFAASLYRRGTPYLRIPTTLIGLVDAGVGVKTGVNYASGKNRVGTYAAAKATFLDRTWLSTLDPRHVSNGLAEVLKVALMKSAELFELLERSGHDLLQDRLLGSTPELDAAAATVVAESIHLMLEELQPNLWESTLERCVDYGHTFSPVIEMRALPSLLHGEAVAVDMALTTVIGELRGYVSIEQSARVLAVMRQLGLPTWDDVLAEPGLLATALRDTVRHRDGQQRLPLPVGIGGHRFVNDVTDAELQRALELLCSRSRQHAAGEAR